MNLYLFWILFFALWAIVPLMILKGKPEEVSQPIAPKVDDQSKKKGWFK